MSCGRLGGGRKANWKERPTPVDSIIQWQVASMRDAVTSAQNRVWKVETEEDRVKTAVFCARAMDTPKHRLQTALERADRIVENVIAINPALAKRHRWVRSEDGSMADCALVAMGDDTPCFDRRRVTIADQSYDAPLRVVVSTDSGLAAGIELAAGVIATIKIVQQWRPVEVWWQGSWLDETRTRGFVFHVPLVNGDMDFSRIEFILADELRDSFSWRLMAVKGIASQMTWNGCGYEATRSYLAGSDEFVAHGGIREDDVERVACSWLGMQTAFWTGAEKEEDARAALQVIRTDTRYHYEPKNETAAEKRERLRREKENAKNWEAREVARMKERMEAAAT